MPKATYPKQKKYLETRSPIQRKSKKLKLHSLKGFEDYRDRLYSAAHRSLETDAALEEACSTFKCDPLCTAISGFTQSETLGENPSFPTAKEAVDNGNALLEIVRIQGELVGKHNFDTYFIQREYESIISPGSVVPGYNSD